MSCEDLTPVPGASFEHLRVGTWPTNPAVGIIELARPKKINAIDHGMWRGFPKALEALESLGTVRAVVLCAQGPHFCAGIDLGFLQGAVKNTVMQHQDPASRREAARREIQSMQTCITVLETFKWPVIAAVQGLCIGAGVELICGCDIRVCSSDAVFSIKEVDLGIVADLGNLQRLPRIVGQGVAVDLSLTCRQFSAAEALRIGLVTQVLGSDRQELTSQALQLAASIADKPASAVVGTKHVLLHNRDQAGSVAVGLDYVALYNSGLLEDLFSAEEKRKQQRSKM